MHLIYCFPSSLYPIVLLLQEQPRNANVRVASGCGEVRCMCMSKTAFTPFLEQDEKFKTMISELVRKKEDTAKARQEMLKSNGSVVAAPEAARNEVKISRLTKKGKTSNGKAIINGYVMMQKLGAGSYGTVWLAQSIAHSKKYAIKVVSRALLKKKRFSGKSGAGNQSDDEILREVAVMKKLQHKNVVALYEVIDDPDGDKFYMVQEYMELGPVMTEREYNHPLHPSVARAYLRDILAGLEYLHFQGVVHRYENEFEREWEQAFRRLVPLLCVLPGVNGVDVVRCRARVHRWRCTCSTHSPAAIPAPSSVVHANSAETSSPPTSSSPATAQRSSLISARRPSPATTATC